MSFRHPVFEPDKVEDDRARHDARPVRREPRASQCSGRVTMLPVPAGQAPDGELPISPKEDWAPALPAMSWFRIIEPLAAGPPAGSLDVEQQGEPGDKVSAP